jgi:hypothetical protein
LKRGSIAKVGNDNTATKPIIQFTTDIRMALLQLKISIVRAVHDNLMNSEVDLHVVRF